MSKPFTVLIHAGLPKTGTTTIQTTLFENRDRLAAASIHMPILGTRTPAHRKFAALWRDDAQADRPALIEALRSTLATARAEGGTMILSSETLSDPTAGEGIGTIVDLVREAGGDLAVLAYARPPVDHLSSSVQQESKAFRRRYTPIEARVFTHIRRADNLLASFPRDSVSFRIFDRRLLAGGDVVEDFVRWCRRRGTPMPDLQAVPVENESLSGWACAMLLVLRDALLDDPGERVAQRFANVRSKLVAHENREGRGAKLAVPAGWVPGIERLVADEWNALVGRADLEAAEREAVRISPSAAIAGPSPMDRSAWILGYRDEAAERRFVAFYAAQPDARIRNLAALLGWRDDAPRAR